MTTDISSETTEAKKQWDKIFKVLKEKSVNPEFYIQQKYSSGMKAK